MADRRVLVEPVMTAGVGSSVRRVGCVGYLNAKPLIHGLVGRPGLDVRFDVPSGLLAGLETQAVDLALCPVIDYHRSRVPLQIVPVGAIGSRGKTLTVRLLSQTPIDAIRTVHVDSHSHTSVVLMQIFLAKQHGLYPRLVPIEVGVTHGAYGNDPDHPRSVLLIGDKVITARSNLSRYPYQIDLGEAWYEMTGLPFVFAVWMALDGAPLGDLPGLLEKQRIGNAMIIDRIATTYAPSHGWPDALAKLYLSELMRYEFGSDQRKSLDQFGALAGELGFIDHLEPIRWYATPTAYSR